MDLRPKPVNLLPFCGENLRSQKSAKHYWTIRPQKGCVQDRVKGVRGYRTLIHTPPYRRVKCVGYIVPTLFHTVGFLLDLGCGLKIDRPWPSFGPRLQFLVWARCAFVLVPR